MDEAGDGADGLGKEGGSHGMVVVVRDLYVCWSCGANGTFM